MAKVEPTNNIASSSETTVELHVCGICFERYNETKRVPKILVCGHTYCQKCLRSVTQHNGPFTTCPVCRKITRTKLKDIPNNFQLLQVLGKHSLLMTASDAVNDDAGDEENDEAGNADNNNMIQQPETYQYRIADMIHEVTSEVNRLKDSVRSLGLDPAHCFPFPRGPFPIHMSTCVLDQLDSHYLSARDIFCKVDHVLDVARDQKRQLLEMIATGEVSVVNGRPQRNDGGPLEFEETVAAPQLHQQPLFDVNDVFNDYYTDSPTSSVYRQFAREGFSDDEDIISGLDEEMNQLSVIRGMQRMLFDDAPSHDDEIISHGNQATCTVCNCQVPNNPRGIEVHRSGARHTAYLRQRDQDGSVEPPPVHNSRRGRGGRGRGGARGRGRRGGGASRQGPVHYHYGGYHMPDPEREPWADHYDEHGDLFRGPDFHPSPYDPSENDGRNGGYRSNSYPRYNNHGW